MFRTQTQDTSKGHRLAIIGLLLLSMAALGITLWIMSDSLKEQEIVSHLIKQLPDGPADEARVLAGCSVPGYLGEL